MESKLTAGLVMVFEIVCKSELSRSYGSEDAHPHPVEQIAKSFGRKLFKDVSQAYASSWPAVYAIAVSRNGANWH